MMKFLKIFILIAVSSFTLICVAQDKTKNSQRRYIKLSDWKKFHSRALTKQDSLDFFIRDKDTLVLYKVYYIITHIFIIFPEKTWEEKYYS